MEVQLPIAEYASNTLLVKEGTHKALLGIKKKSSKMEDDE